jgi:threonine efflux protein
MLTTLLAICLLHWVGMVTPGPNILVVSQLAADADRRSAIFAALGIATCAVIWGLFALLGVKAIFGLHAHMRTVLQVVGSLYLCWIGIQLWRTGSVAGERQSRPLTALQAWRLGFVTNITNPKSALFFGSVFAAALPENPSLGLMLAIPVMLFVNAALWYSILAVAFSHERVRRTYAHYRRGIGRAAGVLMGVFGIRLATLVAADLRPS